MSSILEVLENVEWNISPGLDLDMRIAIAREQLSNAIKALEQGYGPHDDLDDLLKEHGHIDNIPEKGEA